MSETDPTAPPAAPIRIPVDEDGLPILEQPAAPQEEPTTLPAELVQALQGELGGQLELMVREAFVESVKQVALDLKRSFEGRLEGILEQRLGEIIEQSARKTGHRPDDGA